MDNKNIYNTLIKNNKHNILGEEMTEQQIKNYALTENKKEYFKFCDAFKKMKYILSTMICFRLYQRLVYKK